MFRTELTIPASSFQLDLSSKVVTAGSCFSDVIGRKLAQHKVKTLVNPFGTIFNPVSICHLFEVACTQNYSPELHLVQHNGIWYHYDFHSSFSSPDQEVLLRQIEKALEQTRHFLESAQVLILTFGTAVAYQLVDEDKVVANCHKQPDKNFERRLVSYYEMVDAFGAMCAQLKMVNPDLKILLTVSPVRHLKETIPINSVSKAHLRVACHQFTENFRDVFYFPSFELMMDDLRDYRFYKDDMIHPTSLAENYIWQKFSMAYLNREFQDFQPEWEKVMRSLEHTPFHPESKAHESFLKNLLTDLYRLSQKADVAEEIAEVKRRLRTGSQSAAEQTGKHPLPLIKKKKASGPPAVSEPEKINRPAQMPVKQQKQQRAMPNVATGSREEKVPEPIAPEVTVTEQAQPPLETKAMPVAQSQAENRPVKVVKGKKGRVKRVVLEAADSKKNAEPPMPPPDAPAPVVPAKKSAGSRKKKAPETPLGPSQPVTAESATTGQTFQNQNPGPAKKRNNSRKRRGKGPSNAPLKEPGT
jgi:hypothetical protein